MTFERSGHVDDETLVQRACDELTAAEEARVSAHLERCDDCREVWRAVESVRRAAVEFDPGAVPPVDHRVARRPLWRSLRWGGLAAAAVAASVLLWVGWPSGPVTSPVPVVRSVPEQLPTPLSPAEGARVVVPEFSWQPVAGASGYSVDLLDDRGELVWTSGRLASLEAAWPTSVERRAGHYYWRVSAHLEDGEEPIASPLVSFELIAQ